MTNLRERFTGDLKEAMKAGEKGKVAAIRLVQAALKDKDIEARGAGKGEATPDEILALLQKMIKQRQESIAIYDANNRPELAAGERAEVEVISSYLPQQMSDEEVKAAIDRAIAGDRRERGQGYGQGHRRASRGLCRADGFREGQPDGEGRARRLTLRVLRRQVSCRPIFATSGGMLPGKGELRCRSAFLPPVSPP